MDVVPELPTYRLTAPFFGPDNVLYDEGAEIEFDGTPNAAMQPLNKEAHDAYEKFIRSLPDGKTPPLEEIVEKAMKSRHEAIKSEEAQAIIRSLAEMLGPKAKDREPVVAPVMKSEVPLMANDPKARSKLARGRKEKISQKATPDQYHERIAEATKRRIASKIGS